MRTCEAMRTPPPIPPQFAPAGFLGWMDGPATPFQEEAPMKPADAAATLGIPESQFVRRVLNGTCPPFPGPMNRQGWRETLPYEVFAYHRNVGGNILQNLVLSMECTAARLIDLLLTRLGHWMFDLPASEAHHHSAPFGLFLHSLDVALATLQRLEETPEDPDRALLVATLALLHDCGKLLDLEIPSPDGPPWDPLRESLVAIKRRHRMPVFDPTPHRFRRGRGLHGHEGNLAVLAPVLVPPRLRRHLGARLPLAILAYADRRPDPLARHLRAADADSVRRDRARLECA